MGPTARGNCYWLWGHLVMSVRMGLYDVQIAWTQSCVNMKLRVSFFSFILLLFCNRFIFTMHYTFRVRRIECCKRFKVGFHYPSSRAELTAVNSGAFFDTRELGPSWRSSRAEFWPSTWLRCDAGDTATVLRSAVRRLSVRVRRCGTIPTVPSLWGELVEYTLPHFLPSVSHYVSRISSWRVARYCTLLRLSVS